MPSCAESPSVHRHLRYVERCLWRRPHSRHCAIRGTHNCAKTRFDNCGNLLPTRFLPQCSNEHGKTSGGDSAQEGQGAPQGFVYRGYGDVVSKSYREEGLLQMHKPRTRYMYADTEKLRALVSLLRSTSVSLSFTQATTFCEDANTY